MPSSTLKAIEADRDALLALCRGLDDSVWSQNSGCRGWTVQDLVSGGYLRAVPKDPITGSSDTWKFVMEDSSQSVDSSEPGLFDEDAMMGSPGWVTSDNWA